MRKTRGIREDEMLRAPPWRQRPERERGEEEAASEIKPTDPRVTGSRGAVRDALKGGLSDRREGSTAD